VADGNYRPAFLGEDGQVHIVLSPFEAMQIHHFLDVNRSPRTNGAKDALQRVMDLDVERFDRYGPHRGTFFGPEK
jgi:hypothetical protein